MKVQQPFLLLNIELLRKYLITELGAENGDINTLWDYVTLCFMVGNDFLPSLSFLKIKHNGIDMLVQIYKKVKETLKENYVLSTKKSSTDTYKINDQFLFKILEHLKDVEDEFMCEAEDNYYAKEPQSFYGKKSPIEKYIAEIDNYPTYNKFPKKINPYKTGWRLNYYNHLFNITEINEINYVCENYLTGIEWTFNYYFNKSVSDTWYYKYNYSPTILDIYNFLFMNIGNIEKYLTDSIKINFPSIKFDTDLQLLLVLPPSSISLINKKYHQVMTDIKLGCVHYYPIKFAITTYLKIFLWEASANLPQLDLQKVKNVKDKLALT